MFGTPVAYVPLSRPGPNGSRIHTTLGFGVFTSGSRTGSGMFEYSRRVEPSADEGEDADSDSD